jgi:hypothetical protein
LVHGNKYSYDEVNYTGLQNNVKIICLEHGTFNQLPGNHLKGAGCKKCKIKSMFSNRDKFIQKSMIKHGHIYNYTNVVYVSNNTPVEIICKTHGRFTQTPHGHLNGRGCSMCKTSKMELFIEESLKNNGVKYKSQLKFDDLKYQGYLRFDFGIYNNNNDLEYVLEYNGLQHYEFIEYFHKTHKSFTESQKRDQIKLEYCHRNNIKVHIIRYDDNVEESINKIINNYV